MDEQAESSWLPSWRALIAVGLISRVAVVMLGFAAGGHPSPPSTVRSMDLALAGGDFPHPGRLVESWYRFDAVWYAEIASVGYSYRENAQVSAAFLPLLPWCMRFGAWLELDPFWVGLIVPNLAFAVGLGAFGRLTARVTGSSATAWSACALLIAYPWSLFFSAPYQESLCFALTAMSALCWVERKPGRAAVFLLPSGLARLSAMALPAGIIMEWLEASWRKAPRRRFVAVMMASGLFGTAVLMAIMAVRFGDPLASFRVQASWGRTSPSLGGLATMIGKILAFCRFSTWYTLLVVSFLGWSLLANGATIDVRWEKSRRILVFLFGLITLVGVMGMSIPGPWSIALARVANNQRNSLCMILLTGLGVRAWMRHGAMWGTMILLPVLQVAATGLPLSMPRLGLMSYPAAMVAAELIKKRSVLLTVVGLMAIGQVSLIGRFVNWMFVG